TALQQTVTVTPPVTIGQQQQSEVKVLRLQTGALLDGAATVANFIIEAEVANGQHTQRLVPLRIYPQGEALPYDGNVRMVERYAPLQVSTCIPGGDIGLEFTYTESQSESQTRSLSARWDQGVMNSLGGGVNLPGLFDFNGSRQWSSTFGEDVSASVSS